MNSPVYDKYDQEMTIFSENEDESLVFFNHLSTETPESLLNELENICIPNWKENIEIVKRINDIEDLPEDLFQQNLIFLEYSELRLKSFNLFQKAISEDTDEYEVELEQVHFKIGQILEKLE